MRPRRGHHSRGQPARRVPQDTCGRTCVRMDDDRARCHCSVSWICCAGRGQGDRGASHALQVCVCVARRAHTLSTCAVSRARAQNNQLGRKAAIDALCDLIGKPKVLSAIKTCQQTCFPDIRKAVVRTILLPKFRRFVRARALGAYWLRVAQAVQGRLRLAKLKPRSGPCRVARAHCQGRRTSLPLQAVSQARRLARRKFARLSTDRDAAHGPVDHARQEVRHRSGPPCRL